MPVTISVDQKKHLTIFTLVGKISVKDGIDALKSFYDGNPTKKALWDLRNAELSALSSDDIKCFVEYSKSRSKVRAGGKTAWVASDDLRFGLARILDTFSEIGQLPVSTTVCHSMEEAFEWFEKDD